MCTPAAGGAGLVLSGDELVLFGTSVLGGPGGTSTMGCSDADDGAAITEIGGTLTQVAGTAHGFGMSAVVREGASLDLLVEGEPGDLALLGFSLGLSPNPLPGSVTPQVIGVPPASLRFTLGTIPAGGSLSPSFTVGALPPGFSAVLFAQPARIAGGSVSLGQARSVVLLDSVY